MMTHYRIYQLDPADHIEARFSLELGSEHSALRAARALLQLRQHAGVEVWKSGLRIAHFDPSATSHWSERREQWMASY